MSLKPSVFELIPAETVRVARAAFPKGNLYLSMRDELGTLFEDVDFVGLFPNRGQPALAPWRLALITVMQFLENLSDDAISGEPLRPLGGGSRALAHRLEVRSRFGADRFRL